jgi:hypothetical protein
LVYIPKPISSSEIRLEADIVELTEKLAENVHDIWALQRIADGWVYGEERDEMKKTHPCLKPYVDLPEAEKMYDRNTAMETIKAIIALGYSIQKR